MIKVLLCLSKLKFVCSEQFVDESFSQHESELNYVAFFKHILLESAFGLYGRSYFFVKIK